MKQPPSVLQQPRLLARVAAAVGLLACAAPGFAAPDWDFVGLKLGMTEQEARAALNAHDAKMQLVDHTLKYTFNDGVRQQESPAFLATIQASILDANTASPIETIEVKFSPPPLEQRVIGVRRVLPTDYKNPPPVERMLESLAQKYGKALNFATYGDSGQAHWIEAGKPQCGHGADKQGFSFVPASQAPKDLRSLYERRDRKLAPADLSTCGAVLRASLTIHPGGSSVVGMALDMTDVGYMVPTVEAASKWVSDLEAAARKARLNSGATPKL